MKIGEHIGKIVTYREKYVNQTYNGYVFETIIDDGFVLFIADVENELFHNAPTYFHNKHPEFWDDEYKSKCWWIPYSQCIGACTGALNKVKDLEPNHF